MMVLLADRLEMTPTVFTVTTEFWQPVSKLETQLMMALLADRLEMAPMVPT